MTIRNPFFPNAPTYGGPRVAGFDPVRAQGINLAAEAALGPQQQLADAYTSGILGVAQGTDANTQRLAQQSAQAAAVPFYGAGTPGSARSQLAANRAAQDAILDRQFQAYTHIPSAITASVAPSTTLQNIGTTQQNYQQSLIDAQKAQFDEAQRTSGVYEAPVQQAPQPSAIERIGNTASNVANTAQAIGGAFNAVSGLGSTFGFWAEGGEIPAEKPAMSRYEKAKMKKMGG